MARPKKATTGFATKELDLQEAQRLFRRKRGRASKYDEVVRSAERLSPGKALVAEQLRYAEVTALRKKVNENLGEGWKVEAARGGEGLYDVILYREA